MKRPPRTRFAPSPTGNLHVGNAFSALCCQQWAIRHNAELYLRIEDIDHTRCREHYVQGIIEDLEWLGLHWAGDISFQSQHGEYYRQAIAQLYARELIYPCFCTRREIMEEIARSASAPHRHDPSVPWYPGTCRRLARHEGSRRMQTSPYAWRLNIERVRQEIPASLCWTDQHGIHHPAEVTHDLVIGRKDIGVSYHLAVVIDDARQGITDVIRGDDLRPSTAIHRILQYLLDLPAPRYHHHPLIHDTQGKRLAKRHQSAELRQLRTAGVSPARLRHFLLQECEGVWPFTTLAEAVQTLGKRR